MDDCTRCKYMIKIKKKKQEFVFVSLLVLFWWALKMNEHVEALDLFVELLLYSHHNDLWIYNLWLMNLLKHQIALTSHSSANNYITVDELFII